MKKKKYAESKNAESTEKIIKNIISKFLNLAEYKVFIFGSRATGEAKKFSDYDIGIIGKKPVRGDILAMIEEALEESDLLYNVDIVDFSLISSNFKKIALSKIKKL